MMTGPSSVVKSFSGKLLIHVRGASAGLVDSPQQLRLAEMPIHRRSCLSLMDGGLSGLKTHALGTRAR
jgi:hypothetical protein